MTQEELKLEYEKNKDKFDSIKHEIKDKIIRTENYKGFFFEIFPFSYQRNGFKQGKLIENMNRLKSTNDLYTYNFDAKNNIIEVREGIDIENEFYYKFLFYEDDYIKTLFFNNSKTLQNISFYYLNNEKVIKKMCGRGRMGGREEEYYYKDELLEKITIKQFDRNGNEANPFTENFIYDEFGNLHSITKSFENGFSEQIYPSV
jgi:hypothetical protein